MGQRTLAFTRLLLREISYNSHEKHRVLIVYVRKSFIQHTWGITKEQYTKHMQQSKGKDTHVLSKFGVGHYAKWSIVLQLSLSYSNKVNLGMGLYIN
jgi:hypothetical protein